MTGTANAALHDAMDWMIETVHAQPYGEIAVIVTIQDGNVVLIKKVIQETAKP